MLLWQHQTWLKEEKILTHAGDDAVHWEVVLFAALTTFLSLGFKDGVLLLGDVDIEACVCGAHDELGSRVESNAFAFFLLDTNQRHTIPKRADDTVWQVYGCWRLITCCLWLVELMLLLMTSTVWIWICVTISGFYSLCNDMCRYNNQVVLGQTHFLCAWKDAYVKLFPL